MNKSGVKLQEMPTFSGLSGLRHICVSKNLIRRLELGCFEATPLLNSFDASQNLILFVHKSLFQPTPLLFSVDFSNNKLRDAHTFLRVFNHTPLIEQIDIRYNLLGKAVFRSLCSVLDSQLGRLHTLRLKQLEVQDQHESQKTAKSAALLIDCYFPSLKILDTLDLLEKPICFRKTDLREVLLIQ